ncbi:MAG: Fic family protein [Verrucomicrobiota bacterium]
MPYIYERSGWPHFTWDAAHLASILADVRNRQGRLLGRMDGLGLRLRTEASLATLTSDVLKSSAIEGEFLDPEQVRSSIARRLGLDLAGLKPSSRDVEGVVEMMLDATQHFQRPLTAERLFGWHAALFPTGRSGMARITVGQWRTADAGPMQVVSGEIGRERVHFEAPPAERLSFEMEAFLSWIEKEDSLDPVLKTGIAHFWFVTIHPFEDGNGRIGRAIADLLLARTDGMPERFYSMSAQIEAERKDYYQTLEACQRGTLDITLWLRWFLNCLGRALDGADTTLGNTLRKARLWDRVKEEPVNTRQKEVINRLLDGFEGKLTSSKYAKLSRCSPDTALRDIQQLVQRGILVQNGAGGRSTSYELAESPIR